MFSGRRNGRRQPGVVVVKAKSGGIAGHERRRRTKQLSSGSNLSNQSAAAMADFWTGVDEDDFLQQQAVSKAPIKKLRPTRKVYSSRFKQSSSGTNETSHSDNSTFWSGPPCTIEIPAVHVEEEEHSDSSSSSIGVEDVHEKINRTSEKTPKMIRFLWRQRAKNSQKNK